MVWLDIEGPQYWSRSQSANQNFFSGLVSELKARGQHIGVYSRRALSCPPPSLHHEPIPADLLNRTPPPHSGVYTSESQWSPIMGSWSGGAEFPLWFANLGPALLDHASPGGRASDCRLLSISRQPSLQAYPPLSPHASPGTPTTTATRASRTSVPLAAGTSPPSSSTAVTPPSAAPASTRTGIHRLRRQHGSVLPVERPSECGRAPTSAPCLCVHVLQLGR